MPYQHLTQDERYQIAGLFRAGFSRTSITRELGRNPSTITRELQRNRSELHYEHVACPDIGDAAPACRQFPLASLTPGPAASRARIGPALESGTNPWSGRLAGIAIASHTTLYRHIHRRGWRMQLRLLKRCSAYGRGRPKRFADRKPIQQRPPEVDACSRPGDWELDTMRPARGTGALVTMNERVSGFVRLDWSPMRMWRRSSQIGLAPCTATS